MKEHCCGCRSPAVAGVLSILYNDPIVTGILAIGTFVPPVAGIPIVVASTAAANAANVAGIHADDYTKGLKEIADSRN